jgi:hypothetical protein
MIMTQSQDDMFDLNVENTKYQLERQTEKFEPQKNDQPISIIQFWDNLRGLMNRISDSQPLKVKIETPEGNFSIQLEKSKINQIINSLAADKMKDRVIYIQPKEFLKLAYDSFASVDYMLDTFKFQAKLMKALGFSTIDLSCNANMKNYTSNVPIEDAINFLNSFHST